MRTISALVTRFVRRRDETAFAELVRRHGGLVHGVCRRVLRNSHDVEDAFQATFLVLARDAHRILRRRSIVSWLHGVAYRTSLRAAESRHRRIRLLQDVTMIEDSTLADVELRHERQKLDEELAGLPEKYRTPLVLHYLEGKSNADIAKLLGLSVSNVEGRLKRGRKELKLRLTRCGIGLSAALAAVQWSQSLTAATPLETLVGPAIEAGLSYTAGDPAGGLFTHEAARLAGQEMIRMSTLTTTAATLSVLVLVPMAALLSGHDGDPTLPPGGGTVAVTTILAALPEDQPIDESSEAVVTPPVDNSQLPQVSFFTRNGKVYRQTVEELGEVSDSDIISFTGDTGFDVQVRETIPQQVVRVRRVTTRPPLQGQPAVPPCRPSGSTIGRRVPRRSGLRRPSTNRPASSSSTHRSTMPSNTSHSYTKSRFSSMRSP